MSGAGPRPLRGLLDTSVVIALFTRNGADFGHLARVGLDLRPSDARLRETATTAERDATSSGP